MANSGMTSVIPNTSTRTMRKTGSNETGLDFSCTGAVMASIIIHPVELVFEQIRAGGDRNFGYLLGDRDARQAVLIDPSYSPEAFVGRADEQRLTEIGRA